jgi:diguanylate cyclase (GGDEF)-like protein
MMPDHHHRILIVDDTPANIQILNETLQGEYRVYFALSGGDALEKVHDIRPDLILLDVMMPEMDGFEVCRRLKADYELKEIPVIFITALDQPGEESQGLRLGAADYITKPFNPELVLLRVHNHVELKRRQDELEQLSAELAIKNRQLEVLACYDGLTGLANRRCFDVRLDAEIRRANRSKYPLSLLMCDIDYFKPYNDHYGHQAGDDILRTFSQLLLRLFQRSGELPARYGGEEFAVILPDVPADTAIVLAETLCHKLRELALPHHFSEIADHITLSIGVISAVPDMGQDAAWFISRADAALYRSKEQGRNRVTLNDAE